MIDTDSRVQEIVESKLDEELQGEKLQQLIDTIVSESTAELEEELVEKKATIEKLTSELASAVKGRELAIRSHIKQTSFLRQDDAHLMSIANSKNPIIKILAYFAKFPGAVDEYSRLKYETTTEALAEMHQQDTKWGPGRRMPNGTGPEFGFSDDLANMMKEMTDEGFKKNRGSWQLILQEEYFEAMAESNPKKLKAELIQVAAVCLAWIVSLKLEKFRRRQ